MLLFYCHCSHFHLTWGRRSRVKDLKDLVSSLKGRQDEDKKYEENDFESMLQLNFISWVSNVSSDRIIFLNLFNFIKFSFYHICSVIEKITGNCQIRRLNNHLAWVPTMNCLCPAEASTDVSHGISRSGRWISHHQPDNHLWSQETEEWIRTDKVENELMDPDIDQQILCRGVPSALSVMWTPLQW